MGENRREKSSNHDVFDINIDITPFMRATLSIVMSYIHLFLVYIRFYSPVLTLVRQLKRGTEGLWSAILAYYHCNESDFLKK